MKKRHGAEQIVAKLRQADVELGKGLKVPEVCKQLGITVQIRPTSAGGKRTGEWPLRRPGR